ncbi:hypothetical protein LH425_06470 [Laribacter hongkongensis]|uniref:hypothetical protein n=1 Tax=Laribacter hongkongensis TaxID=168471 RepID=UPI001EFE6312|nr:hypothetical protein [Laribacter hongkongensis]MCG9064687.1 hypothetical protein [Laribacter hongkongensis]
MNKLIIIAVEDPVSRGYVERLQRMNSEMRAQVIDLEERHADASEEVHQLKENLMELGRQNIVLAAEAESARFDAEQLDAANARIRELEAALAVSKLPANSRATVIQLVQEAA